MVDQAEAVVAIRREGLFRDLPDWLTEHEPAESQPRTQDVELLFPFTVEWHYEIHVPAGFGPRELPAAETRKLGCATYSHLFERSPDGHVTGRVHFDTGKRRMTASDADNLRNGVAEILKAPPILIYLDQTGEKLIGEGKIGEALLEFRKLSAAEPKEAIHRTRIARALLAAGMGEQARKEARAAVALDPSSATAHQTLGWVLQHDLIGRRFEKGFDLQAAIASYMKAKELDPENTIIRGDLAILLEHNVNGDRYGKGAAIAQAIEEYRALMKLPGGENLLDNLLIVCLHAGRTDVLKEQLAEDMPQDEARRPLYLAVQAVVNGSAGAVQRATRSIADPQKRNLALSQAGLVLMRSRNYSKASEMCAAAARGGQNTAQLLALADQLGKARHWEEVQTSSDRPEGAVQQFFLAFWGAEDYERVMRLLSRHHHQDRFREENIKGWKRGQRPMRSQMAKAGMDADVVADMLVVMMQPSVEGDDQAGYLVKARLPNTNMTVIVVREDGQCRILDLILGPSSSVGFVGYEVLARIEKGRLPEARRLLDWIRDEINPTGGDDPLAGPLLPRFWRKGEPGSETAMRQAAYALLAENKSTAGDAIPFLNAGLRNESDASARERLQLALAVAYSQVEQFEELLEPATALYSSHPTSQTAFSLLSSALLHLGRWDELDRYIENRLQNDARDPDAIRSRLRAAVWRGDLEIGRRQEDLLRQSGKLEAGDLNDLAWLALVAGKVDQRALQTIQEGVLHSKSSPSAALLHTAASLYAEVGKATEAREVLLQSIELQGGDEPDADSWYVLGRIAEYYDEVGAARDMYGKVKKPENPQEVLSSTYALAQRRIEQLKKLN